MSRPMFTSFTRRAYGLTMRHSDTTHSRVHEVTTLLWSNGRERRRARSTVLDPQGVSAAIGHDSKQALGRVGKSGNDPGLKTSAPPRPLFRKSFILSTELIRYDLGCRRAEWNFGSTLEARLFEIPRIAGRDLCGSCLRWKAVYRLRQNKAANGITITTRPCRCSLFEHGLAILCHDLCRDRRPNLRPRRGRLDDP